MPRPRHEKHRQFLEDWPELSELPEALAAHRLGVSLRTFQRWAQELRETDPFETWPWLHHLIAVRKKTPPGPARDKIDSEIELTRWRVDHPFDEIDVNTVVF